MSTLPPSPPRTRRESFADGLTVRVDERGSGRPIIVLHGGGGPQTVSGFAEALAEHAHVLSPIHPGFAGEPRPEWFNSIDDIADVFPLTPGELSALSYHNPAAFRIDPATLSPDQVAAMAANFQALGVYGREPGMRDPKLRRRLGRVRIPALVVWGESDGVVDPDYGRAYAQALPNAHFELIPEAGHVPQIEQPERLLKLVWEFADTIPTARPVAGSFEER